jgi:glc operon protein GlcG
MKLADAIACVDRGIARAQSLGLKLSFAVIDEFGQLVQRDRMDGASLLGPDLAEAKALTALNFGCPTSEVAKIDRAALKAMAEAVHFPVVPVAGGVPILENGELKGAIGVSGATSQQDEEIARHAAGR